MNEDKFNYEISSIKWYTEVASQDVNDIIQLPC